jgi:hypothetical protein
VVGMASGTSLLAVLRGYPSRHNSANGDIEADNPAPTEGWVVILGQPPRDMTHDRAVFDNYDTDAPALQGRRAAISRRGLWNHYTGTPAGT